MMPSGVIRPTIGAFGRAGVGARAARALVTELTRRTDPKTALLVGVPPTGPNRSPATLDAAIDALLPSDTLLLTGPDPAALRAELASRGSWVADRVRVLDDLPAAGQVDVAIRAEPMTGTADQVRAAIAELAGTLRPGGVLTVAAVAVPGVSPGAAAELERQAGLYGVGSDLVVRGSPPVRVHRLCWTPGQADRAEQLIAVDRPSSVRLTRDLHVDSNGVAAVGIALGLAVVAKLTRPRSRWWQLPAAAALPVAAFFRDPPREAPEDAAAVLAASDGKVLSVTRTTDDRFDGDGAAADYLRIAVFLSVLDVHVNRAPVAGRVVDHFLEDGGYAPAMAPEAEHNVAGYTVLETTHGRVAVAQRTGLLARRIVHRAPVGSLLARGERFGLIRFGSRTDVYLPADTADPLVAPGDRVVGGVTAIARWR